MCNAANGGVQKAQIRIKWITVIAVPSDCLKFSLSVKKAEFVATRPLWVVVGVNELVYLCCTSNTPKWTFKKLFCTDSRKSVAVDCASQCITAMAAPFVFNAAVSLPVIK